MLVVVVESIYTVIICCSVVHGYSDMCFENKIVKITDWLVISVEGFKDACMVMLVDAIKFTEMIFC